MSQGSLRLADLAIAWLLDHPGAHPVTDIAEAIGASINAVTAALRDSAGEACERHSCTRAGVRGWRYLYSATAHAGAWLEERRRPPAAAADTPPTHATALAAPRAGLPWQPLRPIRPVIVPRAGSNHAHLPSLGGRKP